MKLLIQRVAQASVSVNGETVSAVGNGLLVFVGLLKGDTAEVLDTAADKLVNLRIFADDEGKFSRSLQDVGGELLVVSQFTLAGELVKGRRPDFSRALRGDEAEPLYEAFLERLRVLCPERVRAGVFGAFMSVSLQNSGPVTIMLDL